MPTVTSSKFKEIALAINTCIVEMEETNKKDMKSLQFVSKDKKKTIELGLHDISQYLLDLSIYQDKITCNQSTFFKQNRLALAKQLVDVEDLISLAGLSDTTSNYCRFSVCRTPNGSPIDKVVEFVGASLPVNMQKQQHALFIDLVASKMIHLYNSVLYVLNKYARLGNHLKKFQYQVILPLTVPSQPENVDVSSNDHGTLPIDSIIKMNDETRNNQKWSNTHDTDSESGSDIASESDETSASVNPLGSRSSRAAAQSGHGIHIDWS